MLYLIEDRDYLKIGYANNIKDRMSGYRMHNCYATLISSKEGLMCNEKELHELCKQWQYRGEWFYNTPEVKQIFEEYNSFKESDFIWLKKLVASRYISLLKDKCLPKIQTKVNNILENLRKEKSLPIYIKKWVDCFYEQDDLNRVIEFFLDKSVYFPKARFDFNIFPNIVIDTSKSVLKCLYEYENILKEYERLKEEQTLLKAKTSLNNTDKEKIANNEILIKQYVSKIERWDVKNDYVDRCIEELRKQNDKLKNKS